MDDLNEIDLNTRRLTDKLAQVAIWYNNGTMLLIHNYLHQYISNLNYEINQSQDTELP